MSTAVFLISHQEVVLPPIEPYRPILAGACNHLSSSWLRDDEGVNISASNPTYNEMSAIYWVYRHLDEFPELDHVGFCHYRRLWCFQNYEHPIFVRKKIRPDWIGVTQDRLEAYWKEFDGVVPYPSHTRSVRRHYEKSHNKHDIPLLLEIVKATCPKYLSALEEYLDGGDEYLYNMFVLPRDLFLEYGDFVFPVLREFAKRRTNQDERLYVSERLTGAFLLHLAKKGRRFVECPLLFTRSRSLRLALAQTRENFKKYPESGFLFKTKPLWLTLLPRFFEQRLRNHSRV